MRFDITAVSTIAAAIFTVSTAASAEMLFDFENEAERKNAPQLAYAGCVKEGAVSGQWSFRFNPPTWRIGLPEWPSFNLAPAVTDWSRYDRLVVDVVSYGETARLSAFIGGTKDRVQTGLAPRVLDIPEQGFVRWTIPLEKWPASAPSSKVERLHFFMTRPIGADIRIDRIMLLAKGEQPPAFSGDFVRAQVKRTFTDRLQEMEKKFPDISGELSAFRKRLAKVADPQNYQELFVELASIISSQRHADAMRIFRRNCIAAGQPESDGFFLGRATAMEKVRVRGTEIPAPADRLDVRLARGEYESLQLFVLPCEGDLRNVRVSIGDLKGPFRWLLPRQVFSATNVKASVLGYVQTKRVAPYTVAKISPTSTNELGYTRVSGKGEIGWWPDPVLDYLDRTDVKKGDLQGFWLRFHAPRGQAPGIYRGEVVVSAGQKELRRLPLVVRVNDFEVPAKTPLPMAITFSPGPSSQFATPEEQIVNARLRKDPEFPGNSWKRHGQEWFDFLAEYYITVDNLYHRGQGYPKIEALKKLAGQGRLDCFNLGYWTYPKSLSEAAKKSWRKNSLGHLKRSWGKAKAAGIEKFAYLYGCDEIHKEFFPQIRWAVSQLKKEFPGVPISTTAYDHSFGTDGELKGIDWFTPLTPKYGEKTAAAARSQGRQVWWYICCSPHEPYANMFVECPAIEGRILMGAQTAKYRPDGFLYYQTSIWNSPRPISGDSAFTGWVARSWTSYHGDGSWTCCGPDGTPLATVRLENFRDGLEDYAYVRLLEKKLAANPGAPWAEEAKKLLAVPENVVKDMKNYTYDPAVIYAWRDAIADLIEKGEKQ